MSDPREEHMKELGEFALLKVLEGKLTIDEATEGLVKRRAQLFEKIVTQ